MKDVAQVSANVGKFVDPKVTAKGERRAHVALTKPETLWFNTGTLCNITCLNCYIESSPTNDRLVYMTEAEVASYLDQLEERQWNVREIAFTGGEPFMNPQMIGMARASLERGYDVLVLTNAMRPLMRKKMMDGILELHETFGQKRTLRISVDHWNPENPDKERGKGHFHRMIDGKRWLRERGVRLKVAGPGSRGGRAPGGPGAAGDSPGPTARAS